MLYGCICHDPMEPDTHASATQTSTPGQNQSDARTHRAGRVSAVTVEAIQALLDASHLKILGGFHPTSKDRVPCPSRTVLLLGPKGADFWAFFVAEPEWQDGKPDPMDRWSMRVIDGIAEDLGGRAIFPFGGPPFLPFFSWALRTGRVHRSPVQLLVHDTEGLMISFRGALALPEHLELADAPPNPCASCAEKPCLSSCPVDALGQTYDVASCKSFLDKPQGSDCMDAGCLARRACPHSRHSSRLAAQSAYHMRQFRG